MLEHLNPGPAAPQRVVVIGAGGFVGSTICRHVGRAKVPLLALTRRELDLLADGAASRLAALLEPADSVVFVSAVPPV